MEKTFTQLDKIFSEPDGAVSLSVSIGYHELSFNWRPRLNFPILHLFDFEAFEQNIYLMTLIKQFPPDATIEEVMEVLKENGFTEDTKLYRKD